MTSREEAEEAFSKALELANCDPSEYYRDFLITRERTDGEEEHEFQKIDFHSNILTEVGINLTEQVQSLQSDLKEEEGDENGTDIQRDLLPFSVDNHDMSPQPVQYIDVDEIPQNHRFRSVLNDRIIHDESDFAEYDDIAYQTYRVKTDLQPRLVAFRNFSAKQIVGKNHRVKVVLEGTNEYSTVQENPVALPDLFDAVYCDGIIFILNPSNFERLFDYFEAYEEDADDVFAYLEDSDINIDQWDRFKKTVKNSDSQLRRMRRIKNRGRYSELNRSIAEEMIQEFDVEVEIGEDDEGEWQIEIDDFRKVGEVLGLMDDDFVMSGMDVLSESEELQKYLTKGDKEPR